MLTFPARLSVEDGPTRRGRLRLSSGEVTWRSPLRAPWDLSGSVVVRAAMRKVRHRRGALEVELRLIDGTSVRLELPEAEAAATVRMLSGREVPGLDPTRIRPSGSTWWATACLALAALWAAFMVLLAFDGYTATGTVVRSAGIWTCAVTWQSPSGTPERDDTDCFGEPPGSSLTILVPHGDYEGAVTTRPMLTLVAAVGAVPLATIGALRLRAVSRRRRTNVTLIRLASGGGGAEVVREPASSMEKTAAALKQDRRRAWAVTAVGALGVVATVALGMIMAEADRELRATGITTVGTVVKVYPDSKWSPGGVDVRFAAGGESATRFGRLGSYAEDYVEGQQVLVLYDRPAPDRFTVDDVPYEPPWTTWPFILTIAGALLAAPTGIWMVRVRRTTARILAAGNWTPVPVRVAVEDRFTVFTTDGGTSWRSWTDGRWGASDGQLRRLRDWWLSRPEPTDGIAGQDAGRAGNPDPTDLSVDEEQAGVSPFQDAWWVREGDRAVFSPDKGPPLMLGRLL